MVSKQTDQVEEAGQHKQRRGGGAQKPEQPHEVVVRWSIKVLKVIPAIEGQHRGQLGL